MTKGASRANPAMSKGIKVRTCLLIRFVKIIGIKINVNETMKK